MVKRMRGSRGNPLRLWHRLRGVWRRPGDIWLSVRIGYFIWRVPHRLERQRLPELLRALHEAPRPAAADLRSSVERVARLSRPWFRLPPFQGRNTCYVRSLVFCRFVDAQGGLLRIHFLVEPRRSDQDRLRGHAWVSVGDEFCEKPQPDVFARAASIYTYPPEGGA